ncbi:MAG: PRC-barrel domain-containing protein [Actinomycetota bacterium]|nr:PRC-barrel domain-containing protein [Actinomycetota bacterium]
MTSQSNAIISKLSESGQTITPASDDIRGLTVKDKDGKKLGKVLDLLIDDEARKVRFMLVEHGGFLGFGDTKSFIPVDDITKITADDVFINHTAEHVAVAPRYDPDLDLVAARDYHSKVYGHYGYLPFWGMGYAYPTVYSGGI